MAHLASIEALEILANRILATVAVKASIYPETSEMIVVCPCSLDVFLILYYSIAVLHLSLERTTWP
jgi:hypothetical protein